MEKSLSWIRNACLAKAKEQSKKKKLHIPNNNERKKEENLWKKMLNDKIKSQHQHLIDLRDLSNRLHCLTHTHTHNQFLFHFFSFFSDHNQTQIQLGRK